MIRWTRVEPIQGGQAVVCRLCGKRALRPATFLAVNTNYAEALRLAVAYAWKHEHSDVHRAALDAFHGPIPDLSREEELLCKIFGTSSQSDHSRRKSAAKRAAELATRKASTP